MEPTQVLIIGAGPSGMISALCLAKLGISCTIVERCATTSQHPKAHELNTRSIEILSELGFTEEELAMEASPESDGARILFCKSINEEFGRIDLEEDQTRQAKYERHLQSQRPYLNISQTALEKIILNKVKKHPLIKVLFNHQWQSLEDTGTHVDSKILDRTTNKAHTIRSQYVLGADGAGSRCRKLLGIKMEGPENIQDFASAYFETNLREHIKTPAKLYWILNPFAPGTFIAHHIEKRWVYMFPVYLNYQKKEQFTKDFFEKLIQIALGNTSINVEVKSISFWRMSAQLAKQYKKGNVILVGDAAHRFPPTGGLGMNTGIADAHNICWKLAAVLNGVASPALLETYEKERRPIAAQNSEESLRNYHKIMDVPEVFGFKRTDLETLAKIHASAPIKWLPKFITCKLLRIVNSFAEQKLERYYKNPSLRAKVHQVIADQIPHFDRIGLDIGYIYEEGALIPDGTTPQIPVDQVTEYIPSTQPGARFPHLDLSLSRDYNSTHDLISYGQFTLMIREDGDAWAEAYHRFVQDTRINIKLIRLSELNLPLKVQQNLVSLCEIDTDGALLIRPDGHVAFRAKSKPVDSFTIAHLFDLILQNELTERV